MQLWNTHISVVYGGGKNLKFWSQKIRDGKRFMKSFSPALLKQGSSPEVISTVLGALNSGRTDWILYHPEKKKGREERERNLSKLPIQFQLPGSGTQHFILFCQSHKSHMVFSAARFIYQLKYLLYKRSLIDSKMAAFSFLCDHPHSAPTKGWRDSSSLECKLWSEVVFNIV